MIDKTNMQGVMNVIRQAEMANSRAADMSLGISNEQQQSRFASDLLAAIRSVNATQMQAAETKTNFEASGDVNVTAITTAPMIGTNLSAATPLRLSGCLNLSIAFKGCPAEAMPTPAA